MKNVTIVGAGALGSHVAMLLRNEADLKVVDFDRVEQKNTLSQFHGKPGVGKLKVQALAQTMQLLWGLRVGTVPHKLNTENDDQLLYGSELIIDCLDNGTARRIVQGFARRSHTPCLHGALAPGGQLGRSVWDEQFVADDEIGQGAATCEGGEHLPFVALVASYVAYSAQGFLTGGIRRGFHVFPAGATAI